MRGQAVQEQGTFGRLAHQRARRPGTARAAGSARSCVGLAHRHPGIGEHRVGPASPPRPDRGQPRSGPGAPPPRRAAPASGASSGGVAMLSAKSSRTAAWTSEVSTLLPSPIQASGLAARSGRDAPRSSCTSAMIWQGCDWSVSPLMIGTRGVLGELQQLLVRVGADHDRVDIARQHARRVGRRSRRGRAACRARSARSRRRPAAWPRPRTRPGCGSRACRRSWPASCPAIGLRRIAALNAPARSGSGAARRPSISVEVEEAAGSPPRAPGRRPRSARSPARSRPR